MQNSKEVITMEEINKNVDTELDIDALDEASGGVNIIDEVKNLINNRITPEETNAYCKHCGQKVSFVRNERKMGANVSIFVCRNRNCIVFGRERDNLQVEWKK